MARYKHLFLVCTNEREPDSPKGSCAHCQGNEILSRLKELVVQNKLKGKVRVTRSGCLDFCAKGTAIAAFSSEQEGPAAETWYTRVKLDDADALFESHIMNGKRLERLAEPDKFK